MRAALDIHSQVTTLGRLGGTEEYYGQGRCLTCEMQLTAVRDFALLITQFSRGLIREQRTRRMIMFYGLLTALVMLFLGSVFFPWLREIPFSSSFIGHVRMDHGARDAACRF